MDHSLKRIWTGIGSRGIGDRPIPLEIQNKARQISSMMYARGYTLRSGGAEGMDTLFESGYPDKKEIYLPWKNFNKNQSPLYHISPEAFELASRHHAIWDKLSDGAKRLMARNCYQALGLDLKTPTDLVICFTWDGCISHRTRSITTGGTGLAIELASLRNIPVINMYNDKWFEDLLITLEEIEHET